MTSGWHVGITVGLASGAALGVAGVGCTMLADDAAPEDTGVFEGEEARRPTCDACVASRCTAAMALCAMKEGCLAVRACTKAPGCNATCRTSCACSASSADGGLSAEILYRCLRGVHRRGRARRGASVQHSSNPSTPARVARASRTAEPSTRPGRSRLESSRPAFVQAAWRRVSQRIDERTRRRA